MAQITPLQALKRYWGYERTRQRRNRSDRCHCRVWNGNRQVRKVIHAEMPKSIEANQHKSGRALRDGLEAECRMFHSPNDFMNWQRIIENSPQENRDRSLQTL